MKRINYRLLAAWLAALLVFALIWNRGHSWYAGRLVASKRAELASDLMYLVRITPGTQEGKKFILDGLSGLDRYVIGARDGTGNLIFGDASVFLKDPVIVHASFSDSTWQIAAIPIGGWLADIRQPLFVFDTLIVLLGGLIFGIAFLFSYNQSFMQNTIADRLKDITRLNLLLSEDIAKRKEVEAALRLSEASLRQREQQLERGVEERTRQLSTLINVSYSINSTLELAPLLNLVLDQLKVVVDYTSASMLTLQDGRLIFQVGRFPPGVDLPVDISFSAGNPLDRMIIHDLKPVVIADITGGEPYASEFRRAAGENLSRLDKFIRSWMGVPLMFKGEAIGMLALDHSEPDRYTDHDASLVMTFANQAAIAIENARLYAEAQKLAVLQERQRLARELHDSVSQALYGISLGTHTARALAQEEQISRERLAETLEYTLNLATAGLAEMRALIFELRPESLEKEGLTGALTKQAAALQARHQLVVRTFLGEEPDIPIEVKEALFRVAQEALNNAIKHAKAQALEVHLFRRDGAVILEVQDDGIGFDPAGSFPGHLGLQTMRERVTRHLGTFELSSSPGAGTCVRALVPAYPRSTGETNPD